MAVRILRGSTLFLIPLVAAVLLLAWNALGENRKLSRGEPAARAPSISADDPSIGPAGAAVTIIELGDFQCPSCKLVHPDIQLLLARYGNRIRLVWKDFPIQQQHPQALTAAVAARCAHEQGKFWEMHDRLFAEQDNLSATRYTAFAQDLGLQLDQFTTCVNTAQTTQRITAAATEAAVLGVDGVPTFFINGVLYDEPFDAARFEQAVQGALAT